MCYRKAETKGKRSNKWDWRRMPPESSSPTDVTRVLWTSTHYNWDYLLNANIPFKTLGSERAESFYNSVQFSSVAQLWLTLQSQGQQHARPPCPSSIPGVCSNSCPLGQWCYPTISSSVFPFSSHLQSFPASGSFKRVSSLPQVPKILEFQLQHQSFKWIFRTDFL